MRRYGFAHDTKASLFSSTKYCWNCCSLRCSVWLSAARRTARLAVLSVLQCYAELRRYCEKNCLGTSTVA